VTGSSTAKFTDPQAYQAAVRPAQVEILVTAKGDFHAELTRIELPRLWMQRGRESLPRVAHSTVSAERPPVFFLASSDQPAMRHSGMDVSFGEIIAVSPRSTHHHRTVAPCQWATMSLPQEDLAATGHALVGRDLTAPAVTRRLRPPVPLMSRLLSLQEAAGRLAEAAAHILAQREPARALEQALVHALIMCLAESTPVQISSGGLHHLSIVARFEELLAANHDYPLYIAEICAAIGVSERMLRLSCQEHLGMGPVRYLWLRRMHLAHHALVRHTTSTATVAGIATEYGFWELGRFSVQYRALFGEAPSASLRRPPEELRKSNSHPFSFAASEYA
jgi:AraC-like DNA-binding protein